MRLRIPLLALAFPFVSLAAAQDSGTPSRPDPATLCSRVCRVNHDAPGGAVVDGDTIRLLDLDASVRIFGVDAEETFKGSAQEEAAAKDFEEYARAKRANKPRPVKFPTPFGMTTKQFSVDFFRDVKEVTLVPDDPRQERDYYGRYLAHLLVEREGKKGTPENFAVELVRAGHSPYFVKYGTSRLFHDQFVAAEEEARKNGRGIWSRGADVPSHYLDYPERLKWWNRRRDEIAGFEKDHARDPEYFRLGYDDVLDRLKKVATETPGRKVILFGTVGEKTEPRGEGLFGTLAHRNRRDIPVLFPTPERAAELKWSEHQEEFVYLEGTAWPSSLAAGVEIRIDKDSRLWQEAKHEDRN